MICRITSLLLALFVLAIVGCNKNTTTSPNIVVIVADDLGYGDVGFHGSDIHTPNLDDLASQGVQLEQFYVAPMCTPTRAGLMTGRYPLRFGLMRSVVPPYRDFGLDTEEDTLPEMLSRAGYQHRACIGKWHLGHAREKWYPLNQGFTYFMGCLNGAIDYFSHEREGEMDWHRNGEPFRKEGYSTDLIGDEAVSFIESIPSADPYFLYVPFNAPHGPFQAKDEDIAKYPDREGRKQIYAAMVDSMDQSIGRILKAIEERGDADNTFVLFFSDNGGVKDVGDNGPQRGSKLTVFQGGIRVAALVRWPEGGLTGGSISNARIGYIDVMPTIKGIVGLKEASPKPFDGLNVIEAIQGKATLPDRPWFTYLDQFDDRIEHLALNYDGKKIVVERPAEDSAGGSSTLEIFAIGRDTREEQNIADAHPEDTRKLLSEVDAFLNLRSPNQIPRYPEGKEGFVVPKDWQIKD